MGYADGFYYGQGRIICDTSTFSVGDTIRVRSMTDSSKVWNQQVATVGTALVFTVPCYDYYKICTVQDIGGVLTEIGGVYKTVDYGQTLFIDNMLDLSTLRGIQGVLNAHNEEDILNIADEVDITVNGSDWTMQIGRIDGTNHFIDFVSKYIYSTSYWNSVGSDSWYSDGQACQEADAFYSLIAQKDKQFIKETRKVCAKSMWGTTATYETIDKYVWLPKKVEVDGTLISANDSGTQFPIFVTQANRIKSYNGVAMNWWTCDGYARETNPRVVYGVTTSGTVSTINKAETQGILPCFRLTADS